MTASSPEVRWLASVAPHARRVATVCTGAFIAALAGLLDGRRVATHWRYASRLQRDHPALRVDADAIFVRDDRYWTSAGVTAGIDLALALVEDDCGVATAQAIARELVMFVRRPGGQSQFAAPTWIERAEPGPIRCAQELIDAAPGDDHRVPVLAARVGLSERHFTRTFARQVGMPPARYVERVRLDAARRLLETANATTEVVARSCGFGTGETLRRVFHRHLGVAPDDYRRRFANCPA
jgi:transcriptional regulator GlxA family with amidase domain